MANRLVGYVRVSTEKQVGEGVSLAAQRNRIVAYTQAFIGVTVVAIEEDAGISAKTLNRPGLQRAFRMLHEGQADGILVTKLDRLTRSVRDLGELVEWYFAGKWVLVSIGDSIDTRSAAGRLVLNVLGSVGQWE